MTMRPDLADELQACRRLGLVVDEDFERGIVPRQRRIRAGVWCLAAATLGLLSAAGLTGRALATPRSWPERPAARATRPPAVPHQGHRLASKANA